MKNNKIENIKLNDYIQLSISVIDFFHTEVYYDYISIRKFKIIADDMEFGCFEFYKSIGYRSIIMINKYRLIE